MYNENYEQGSLYVSAHLKHLVSLIQIYDMQLLDMVNTVRNKHSDSVLESRIRP